MTGMRMRFSGRASLRRGCRMSLRGVCSDGPPKTGRGDSGAESHPWPCTAYGEAGPFVPAKIIPFGAVAAGPLMPAPAGTTPGKKSLSAVSLPPGVACGFGGLVVIVPQRTILARLRAICAGRCPSGAGTVPDRIPGPRRSRGRTGRPVSVRRPSTL